MVPIDKVQYSKLGQGRHRDRETHRNSVPRTDREKGRERETERWRDGPDSDGPGHGAPSESESHTPLAKEHRAMSTACSGHGQHMGTDGRFLWCQCDTMMRVDDDLGCGKWFDMR